MTDGPLVSVLVTTYNHAPYIEQALDSVAAQEFDDFELIITDDCSQDGSADVIRTWLERTGMPADLDVHERNVGICAARNRAIARSRGRLLCSLSGDDWYEPDRLARQAPFLNAQDEDVAAVYSDVRVVNPDGSVRLESYLAGLLGTRVPPEGWLFEELHRANFLPAMGVMVRRSAIDAVGGYDEALTFEDWDMWLRLADRYRFRYLDMTVANRRELATSLGHAGHRTPRMQRSVVRLLEKWLDRDATAAQQSAYWMRRAALTIAEDDAREARAILRRVAHVPSPETLRWRALSAALVVPGAGAAIAPTRRLGATVSRLVQAEMGAWRNGRR